MGILLSANHLGRLNYLQVLDSGFGITLKPGTQTSEPNPFNVQDSGFIKAYGNQISKI